MNPTEQPWEPDPELLAAYFDGEFEGRAGVAEIRAQIEAWLEVNPDADADFGYIKRLHITMQDTAAPEPPADAWQQVADKIHARLTQAPRPVSKPLPIVWLTACAAIVMAFVLYGVVRFATMPVREVVQKKQPAADEEVLPVATADEVTILSVDGADTHTLVVGELPIKGPLELADVGDVTVTSIQPDSRDRMTPEFLAEARRPMIWARTETDE